MDLDCRRRVVVALNELAEAADYRDRADAGRALASFAEIPEARQQLLALVLDPADTFVTYQTAQSLLRRQDTAGLDVVAQALAIADFQRSSWIRTAVVDVFGIFARERDGAIRTCDAITRDAASPARQGAAMLRDMLAELSPVLYPQQGQ